MQIIGEKKYLLKQIITYFVANMEAKMSHTFNLCASGLAINMDQAED